MARVPKLLDVSVPLAAGMPAYPGNPDFELQPLQRIAQGGSSNVSRLVLGTHTGTHVDAPKHFIDDGAAVEALSLELLLGRARVVEIMRRGGIGAEDLAAAGLREDLRVLLKTPNSALWNTGAFHEDYTHLTESGAALSRRPGSEGGRHRLPVGRTVPETRRSGAPQTAVERRDHHRGPEPVGRGARNVRDVLPSTAGHRRRRRTGARRAQALKGSRAGRRGRDGPCRGRRRAPLSAHEGAREAGRCTSGAPTGSSTSRSATASTPDFDASSLPSSTNRCRSAATFEWAGAWSPTSSVSSSKFSARRNASASTGIAERRTRCTRTCIRCSGKIPAI